MKVRKVNADVLETSGSRARSAGLRERKRMELESKLEDAIRRSMEDRDVAFRIELEEGEKPATVRLAFNRVADKLSASDVNLFLRRSILYVANRPQTRGRRRAGDRNRPS